MTPPTATPSVAFDVTPLLGFRSGMGRATAEMWAALDAMRSEVRMAPYALGVDPGASTDLPPSTRRIRVPTRALVQAWSRTDRLSMDRWLPPADVVHATNFTIGPTRRPTLLTVQDIGFVLDPTSADRVTGTFPGMLRRAVDRGAHVHVTTSHVARQVEEHFGPGLLAAGRITVVALGIPALAGPGPLPGALAGALAGHRYVLALGDQVARKNLPFLVQAFGRVAGDVPDLRLVLAGREGPATPAIRKAVAALGTAAARVVLPGPVDDGARVTLLSGATALAYPSTYEGFGLPPLEAMALGVPALVSRAGALAEVAGPAAELLDPDDVAAWAEALLAMATDDDRRRRLVDAGRRHAARFTWRATASGLLEVYRRLAASS